MKEEKTHQQAEGDSIPAINIKSSKHCEREGCYKLSVHNWLKELPETDKVNDIVEVRFKNTRKAFYRNVNNLKLKEGDIVAVEANPGHDIGIVSLVGELSWTQLKKYHVNPNTTEFKKIYRKAKDTDITKWQEAIADEKRLLVKSREVANRLHLNMKIGDVECQGDKTKAIFYYIADDRVDFREMIKILADELRIRIEMRQIGARQEAGRIGGTGPCGRELCCTTWLSNFVSVTTNAARIQDISLNPQKLAGQCSKLKCCINYEVPVYLDKTRHFPDTSKVIETREGKAYHKKTDILKEVMWYSFSPDRFENLIALDVERVHELLDLNKKNIIPETLLAEKDSSIKEEMDYAKVVGNENINRFNRELSSKNKKRKKNKNRRYGKKQ